MLLSTMKDYGAKHWENVFDEILALIQSQKMLVTRAIVRCIDAELLECRRKDVRATLCKVRQKILHESGEWTAAEKSSLPADAAGAQKSQAKVARPVSARRAKR